MPSPDTFLGHGCVTFIYTTDHKLLTASSISHEKMLVQQFGPELLTYDKHGRVTAGWIPGIYGRVSDDDSMWGPAGSWIAFWQIEHEDLVKPCLRELLHIGAIYQDTKIAWFGQEWTGGGDCPTVAAYLVNTPVPGRKWWAPHSESYHKLSSI